MHYPTTIAVVSVLSNPISLFAIGWPVSAYCIVSLIAAWTFRAVTQIIKKEPTPDTGFFEHCISEACSSIALTALCVAIGSAVIWIVQIYLNLFTTAPNANTIGANELAVADIVAWLSGWFGWQRMATLVLGSLALAVVLGQFWPIGALGFVRRWGSRAMSVLAAISMFSFVGINAANARYQPVSGSLRAQIYAGLNQLAKTRREAAAFHLLATAAQAAQTKGSRPEAWGRYVKAGLGACAQADSIYHAAYLATYPRDDDRSHRCKPEWALARLAADRLTLAGLLQNHSAGPRDKAPATAAIPDYTAWLEPGPSPDAADTVITVMVMEGKARAAPGIQSGWRLRPMTIAQLRKLLEKIRHGNTDAAAARDTLRDTAGAAVAGLFATALPEDLRQILEGDWCDDIAEAIAGEGMGALMRGLAETRLATGRMVRQLLAVDGRNATISPPPNRQRDDAAGAALTALSEYKLADNQADIEAKARQAAAHYAQEDAHAAALAEAARRIYPAPQDAKIHAVMEPLEDRPAEVHPAE